MKLCNTRHKPWRPWRWTLMRWSSEFHEAEANGHPTWFMERPMAPWLLGAPPIENYWKWKPTGVLELEAREWWRSEIGMTFACRKRSCASGKMCILVAPADCCCPRIGRSGKLWYFIAKTYGSLMFLVSLDWFKGKSTGNHGFYH